MSNTASSDGLKQMHKDLNLILRGATEEQMLMYVKFDEQNEEILNMSKKCKTLHNDGERYFPPVVKYNQIIKESKECIKEGKEYINSELIAPSLIDTFVKKQQELLKKMNVVLGTLKITAKEFFPVRLQASICQCEAKHDVGCQCEGHNHVHA
jgi:hypothetical protein